MRRRAMSASGHHGLPALLALALLAGCTPAMSTPPPDSLTIVPTEWPLRFSYHNFAAHCYDTIGCTVIYNGRYQVEDAPDEVAPPPRAPEYRTWWSGAVEVGIENFPAPAIVKWRSRDGQPHEAQVDIGAIFADQKILHHVARDEIPEGWTPSDPEIFLEVKDRTISVYMLSDVATKDEQTPGNKYSHHRDELTLAWSKTF